VTQQAALQIELRNTLNTCDVHDDITDCDAIDLHSNTPYVLFDCTQPLITSVVFKLCSAVSSGSVGYYSYHVLMFNLTNIFMYQSTKVSIFFSIKLSFIILHFAFSYAYSLLVF